MNATLLWTVVPSAVFFGWLAMQGLALWRLEGGWRIAAWAPALAMGAAVAAAAVGMMALSNLMPLWIVVFAIPPCFLWLLALWLLRLLASLAARG